MPPLVGVAVNVTLLPEQVGLDPDVTAMLTDGVSEFVRLRAIGSLVAVGVVTQLKLVVITHVMLPAAVPGSV